MKDKKLLAILIGFALLAFACLFCCIGIFVVAASNPKYDLSTKHTYGVIVPPFDQKTENVTKRVTGNGKDLVIEPQYGRTLQLHVEKVKSDSVTFSVKTYTLDKEGNTTMGASCTDKTEFTVKKGETVKLRTCYLGVTDTWELTLNNAK